jgi:ribonuclease HI
VFDGGSRGNPGEGYGSFELRSPTGKKVADKLVFGDQVTNNQAEYLTLISALERLLELLGDRAQRARLIVRGDSQLVIRQLQGAWKVRNPELKPLHARAVELLRQFGSYELVWQPRQESVKVLGH